MPPATARQQHHTTGLGDVLDALPFGLYVVDRNLRVVAWNRQRESGPIGVPRDQALGRPLSRVLGPAGFRATEPVLRRVFSTGEGSEQTVHTGAGVFHVRRVPVRRGSEVAEVLSAFEDITARREHELRLIAADRLAFLGQLVSGVANEIANPLAGIAGCVEELASLAAKGGWAAAREARRFRELVRDEIGRCEKLVRLLLESSTAPSGARADVVETVDVVLRLLEKHPSFARVRVRSLRGRRLPEAAIDPDSLKQVVLALLMNASAAMPDGGTLSLSVSRRGDVLRLRVGDTGRPVPPAERARLFDPYAANGAPRAGGLGLAIARSLLRAHGGELLYAPGRDGNGFCVVLRAAGAGR